MKLIVSEAFYSLQGEGASSGYPALFIRFSKCNLNCVWCDSQEVMSKEKEIDLDELIEERYFDRVVFTGGEPMLYQQTVQAAMIYIKLAFPERRFYFEIETNGTVMPNGWFFGKGIQFNISPKLANSKIAENRRSVEANIMEMLQEKWAFVKFVVNGESDMKEIERDFEEVLEKHRGKVFLMPAGMSRKALEITAKRVAEICIEKHLKFSNRQHIILWDTKKGI